MNERSDRLRATRAANAPSTGRAQRLTTWYVVAFVVVVGVFMLLCSVLSFTGWSLAGALVWLSAAGAFLRADHHRVETVEVTDRPAHRAELSWFVAGIALLAVGVLLTIHPW